MSNWNPQPKPDYDTAEKSNYHAGYSDAYHGYDLGAGHENPKNSPSYMEGWVDGMNDAASTPTPGV